MTDANIAAETHPATSRYRKGVDRTLLRRNLTLTPEERLLQLQELARFADELRRAGRGLKPDPHA